MLRLHVPIWRHVPHLREERESRADVAGVYNHHVAIFDMGKTAKGSPEMRSRRFRGVRKGKRGSRRGRLPTCREWPVNCSAVTMD